MSHVGISSTGNMAAATVIERIPVTFVISDSWLLDHRIVSPRVSLEYGKKYLNIAPHNKILDKYGDQVDKSIFKNYAVRSLTFTQALDNTTILSAWGRTVPNLTIIHLGACDLANTNLGVDNPRVEFVTLVKKFVTTWIKKAREYSQNQVQYDNDVSTHKWLLVGPPDWGDFGEGRGILDSVQYREARKQARSGLDRSAMKLWYNHRIVLCKPRVDNPDLAGVHLRNDSLQQYNKQIWDAASKLLCTSCNFTEGYYHKPEHEQLTDNRCKGTLADESAGASAY